MFNLKVNELEHDCLDRDGYLRFLFRLLNSRKIALKKFLDTGIRLFLSMYAL